MNTETTSEGARPDEQTQVREQIEHTREELGDTVEALAHKVDVKAQVKERVDETKQGATERLDEVQTTVKDLAARAKEDPKGFAQTKAQEVTAQVKEDPKRYAAIAAACAAVLLLVRRRVRRHR